MANSKSLLGPFDDITVFITLFAIMNGVIIALYLIAKWGNELIEHAAIQQNEVKASLNELENTFQEIEKVVKLWMNTLRNSNKQCSEYLDQVNKFL